MISLDETWHLQKFLFAKNKAFPGSLLGTSAAFHCFNQRKLNICLSHNNNMEICVSWTTRNLFSLFLIIINYVYIKYILNPDCLSCYSGTAWPARKSGSTGSRRREGESVNMSTTESKRRKHWNIFIYHNPFYTFLLNPFPLQGEGGDLGLPGVAGEKVGWIWIVSTNEVLHLNLNENGVVGDSRYILSFICVAFLQKNSEDSGFFTGLYSYFTPSSTVIGSLVLSFIFHKLSSDSISPTNIFNQMSPCIPLCETSSFLLFVFPLHQYFWNAIYFVVCC